MRVRREVFEKHVETVRPGAVVFREGESGSVMYIIIDGEVEITKNTSGSSAKRLSLIGTGDIFGEMAVLEKKPRSASATALRQTRLLVLNETLFYSMIKTNPDFAVRMIRLLSERLRRTNMLIQGLITNNRESQVLDGLQEFAAAHGTATVKGRRVNREQFARWASEHLGIPSKEVYPCIDHLLERHLVARSAAGHGELLVQDSKNAVSRR